MGYLFKKLVNSDLDIFKLLLKVFGEAFEDREAYQSAVPSDAYLQSFLDKQNCIVLAALDQDKVIGGLVAYELEKFEQERREIYIYDLAVLREYRRKGVATDLINKLKQVAKEHDAYVIYVQADHGDEPAIKLYESMGIKENVYHFDIPVH